MSEEFTIVVREDEIAPDILADKELLLEVLYFVWSNEVESKGGIAVSNKDGIWTKKMDVAPGLPGAIPLIRVTGWARRT